MEMKFYSDMFEAEETDRVEVCNPKGVAEKLTKLGGYNIHSYIVYGRNNAKVEVGVEIKSLAESEIEGIGAESVRIIGGPDYLNNLVLEFPEYYFPADSNKSSYFEVKLNPLDYIVLETARQNIDSNALSATLKEVLDISIEKAKYFSCEFKLNFMDFGFKSTRALIHFVLGQCRECRVGKGRKLFNQIYEYFRRDNTNERY